jgi:hypothetical protein
MKYLRAYEDALHHTMGVARCATLFYFYFHLSSDFNPFRLKSVGCLFSYRHGLRIINFS